MSKIGFIGLGIMGSPMAGHLIAGGHTVYTYTVGDTPKALIEAGAQVCANGAEVARKADIIITMVPDTPHVEDALFNPNGVAAGLSKGKIVVDMSSISPVETKKFAQRINALGCDYLDAPVSGGEVGAKSASLTIMALNIETVGEALLFAARRHRSGETPAAVPCPVPGSVPARWSRNTTWRVLAMNGWGIVAAAPRHHWGKGWMLAVAGLCGCPVRSRSQPPFRLNRDSCCEQQEGNAITKLPRS